MSLAPLIQRARALDLVPLTGIARQILLGHLSDRVGDGHGHAGSAR